MSKLREYTKVDIIKSIVIYLLEEAERYNTQFMSDKSIKCIIQELAFDVADGKWENIKR